MIVLSRNAGEERGPSRRDGKGEGRKFDLKLSPSSFPLCQSKVGPCLLPFTGEDD